MAVSLVKPLKPGAGIMLDGCRACADDVDDDTGRAIHPSLSGWFIVEEFLPYEPANYVHTPVWIVVDSDGCEFAVEVDDLLNHLHDNIHTP